MKNSAAWFSLVAASFVACGPPNEVEVKADGTTIFASRLGGDRLLLSADMNIDERTAPQENLTVDVDSSSKNVELLFFPMDAEDAWREASKFESQAKIAGVAVGFRYPYYPDWMNSFPVGSLLQDANSGSAAIKSAYFRKHGECESVVPWESLLNAVVDEVKGGDGEGDCIDLGPLGGWCGPNFENEINQRVASSYLRREEVGAVGGFGLRIAGEASFDSWFIDDLNFYGKGVFDVALVDGQPRFTHAMPPRASYSGCSQSPATICPRDEVRDGVKDQLQELPQRLNEQLNECLAVPMQDLSGDPLYCSDAQGCASAGVVGLLAGAASAEATRRGMSQERARLFRDTMQLASSWRCAPVSDTCASLLGSEPNTDRVCQLELKATDLIPMPDSFSLVWYPGDPGTNPVTAAQALYLGLSGVGSLGEDALGRLCGEEPSGPILDPSPSVERKFSYVSR